MFILLKFSLISGSFDIYVEIEMMKERFAKLLLGEDMSGGGKGVCTALAISNAITNLSGQSDFSNFPYTHIIHKRTDLLHLYT